MGGLQNGGLRNSAQLYETTIRDFFNENRQISDEIGFRNYSDCSVGEYAAQADEPIHPDLEVLSRFVGVGDPTQTWQRARQGS